MSIERINNDESNQVIIEKLRAVIEIESSKPTSEQDVDLIDECVDYLMELENGIELTQKELEKGKQQIYMLLNKKNKPQKKLRFKGLLIAACLAVFMLLANFVALACGVDTVSILKEWGHNIIEMFDGEKEEFNGVTIIKENQILTFNSIEEFKKETSFDILAPSDFPENTKLNIISVAGSYDKNNNYVSEYFTVSFATNDPDTGVIIHTNPDYSKDFISNANLALRRIGEFDCYLYIQESMIQCTFIHKESTYIVKAKNNSDLEFIIKNLREI